VFEMKSTTPTAIVAISAIIIGLAGAVPFAQAQQQAAPQHGPQQGQAHDQLLKHRPGMGSADAMRPGFRMRGGGGGNPLLGFACSARGAERLEIAFVRLSYRLDLNPSQQALFDDLKAAALTAQAGFADACAAARPAPAAGEPAKRDPLARMQARLAIGKARTAALESVLPKFEALYNSLGDDQKSKLTPQRGRHFGQNGHGHFHPGFNGMMRPGFPAMPHRPMLTPPANPAAPPEAPAPDAGTNPADPHV
jgi:hypothetical protein